MATNNHALIRYRTLDRCLKSKNKDYALQDLINECSNAVTEYVEFKTNKPQELISVSRRSIMYDLKYMKDDRIGFGAPIVYDKTDGYYYEDENFEIFKTKLSGSDIDKLNEALLVLKDLSGDSQYHELESLVTRIDETYLIKRKVRDRSIIQFESSTNIEGQKWLTVLKDFIAQKIVLTIDYQPFGKEAYLRTISPYLIKEYNSRWFLIGWDHDMQLITNLGMDRILSVKESIKPYVTEESFDSKLYAKNLVGVSTPQDKKKTKIKLKAHGIQRYYLKTKPIHESQVKIKEHKDYTIFQIEVIPNFELQSKILANADSIEVISPKFFKIEIAKRIKNGSLFYS